MSRLWVRERPPTRLDVQVTPPGSGRSWRWAQDEPLPANQAQGLTFGTTMPGGFSTMSCTLERDPRRSYPDAVELANVTVLGAGGQVAWDGRLEDRPDVGGQQAQLTPQCGGWQNHLADDNTAAMIYIDQNLAAWQPPDLNRQIQMASQGFTPGSTSVAADPTNNLPALVTEVDDAWTTIIPFGEAWYDSGVAGPLASLWYQFDNTHAPTPQGGSWSAVVGLSSTDALSTLWTAVSGNLATNASVKTGTVTGSSRWAGAQLYYNAQNAGTAGYDYKAYWQLAVYGNHGLTPQGALPGGFLATQVAQHAVGTWAPLLTFPAGSVQPSLFVIPQLAFPTPTTAANIVQTAAAYELLDWAVWENKGFWINPPGQSARTRNWRCRIGDCQLQETGPSLSRIANGVIVQYTGVDGNTYTAGPTGSTAETVSGQLLDPSPSNPANSVLLPNGQPLRRWQLLTMGTTTPAAAVQVGAAYLQAQATLDTSGQASLIGHVQDDHGVWFPAWRVRAGDTLAITDAHDPSPRRIVSTSYSDGTRTNTVQLGTPPDTITALLERMSAVIQKYGLS